MTTTVAMIKTSKHYGPGKRGLTGAGGKPKKRFRPTESFRTSNVIFPRSMSQDSNPPELDTNSSPPRPPPKSTRKQPPPSPPFDHGDDHLTTTRTLDQDYPLLEEESSVPLSPPRTPPPLPLFRSLYQSHFDRAMRAIRSASRQAIPRKSLDDKKKPGPTKLLPPNPTSIATVNRYISMATKLVTSLRESSSLFHLANSSFVNPKTRSLYSRYLRLKVLAVVVNPKRKSENEDSLSVGVEVIKGSVFGGEAENQQETAVVFDQKTVGTSNLLASTFYSSLSPTHDHHLPGCPKYRPGENDDVDHPQQILSSPPPAPPSTPQSPPPNMPFRTSPNSLHFYPKNAIFPVGSRFLLFYGSCPLKPEYYKPEVTILRLYPNWSAVGYPQGVKLCCTSYHNVILDGFNFALEGVTS